ncbi:MAG: cobaltochelatase subunit CobN [Alphaproteobacteria bacterium]|nr:cobaltochelatase subunit CobN [Alphaproteobacteria bacterium]
MHLLAAQPGEVGDDAAAVDLGQTPGDIVTLTAADSEIASLSAARAGLAPDFPSLRAANLLRLKHNLSVDLYLDAVAARARLVAVRLLGGRGYWPYGVDELVAMARRPGGPKLALLPGDDQPDPELLAASTLPAEACHRLWQYLVQGGLDNAREFLRFAAHLIGRLQDWREPAPLLRAGLYWPGASSPSLAALRQAWRPGRPVAAIVFYRALMQAANTETVDALVAGLDRRGLDALPVFVAGLKDPVAASLAATLLAEAQPDIVLNMTGFAVGKPGDSGAAPPFDAVDAPVLQLVAAQGDAAAWRSGTTGLKPTDIAMNVALPEVDGRVLAGAVAFKHAGLRDAHSQADIVRHLPEAGRVAHAAGLAAAWVRLRRAAPGERRIALVLANYPNRDGRIGNGVGLDTPASVAIILGALADAGYAVVDAPRDGDALMARLLAGPTNAPQRRAGGQVFLLADYRQQFESLPPSVRDAVTARWGAPEADPFFRAEAGGFVLPLHRFGNVALGVQPARGYNIDPQRSYHDPALVPPHGYLAFYAWLSRGFDAHAVVHVGKHGNLEWLPGKSIALSEDCFPEAAFGALPQVYPFIVNDPGEGTQAKRRTAAVIVDHLTPPLTRAGSYGPLRELELLVDEYYAASGVDPRRLDELKRRIVELAQSTGIAADCGLAPGGDGADVLKRLDAYLCELKDLQIRDGLHVFGRTPDGERLTELLAALARVPRAGVAPEDAGLTRALAADLALGFDPLGADMGAPWTGPRPGALGDIATDAWRSAGDTVERIEALAAALIGGARTPEPAWSRTRAVLAWVDETLRPAVARCGEAEIAGLLCGLDGRFVAPGPAGAPSRGRPDVLPTGRNFYSLDPRAVPTPAAWALGWRSAGLLMERHAQEHGDWPRRIVLSAWGTSNMRTGGDDVAQGLALMGVRPRWEGASGRVIGYEILPASVLDRPRVDVTLRVSGFFRDAFPNLIELFDAAARAVARLDEPERDNPLAAAVRSESRRLEAGGLAADEALRRAGFRVFGSKPGAYGAGLQALIDERGWQTEADLARAVVAWGGYAYGAGAEGRAAHGQFEARLARVEAVVQNQDNREHDLLDSDDYYQFEGGLAVAARVLSGAAPAVYHNDHSRPEMPRIRTLQDEIARVVRARVVNPKWIEGVMRHGYKGAAEIAATVDYLFAFAATARAVADHHFDAAYQAFLADDRVRTFIEGANPAARAEIARRLLEAQDRGLWQSRINSANTCLKAWTKAP